MPEINNLEDVYESIGTYFLTNNSKIIELFKWKNHAIENI